MSATKNPVFVESGRRGAEVRWTPARRTSVRLDALSVAERAIVLALIEAKKASAPENRGANAQEVENRADTTTATPTS